jgi:dienelactone hydrolase
MARNLAGETVLGLCLEYEYDYLLPAFVAAGGEQRLIMQGPSSPALIDYCDVLLTAGGVASRVAPLVAEGLVVIGGERALDMLAQHPRIRADRIAVMGFSKGAVAAVYSAMTRFQALYGNPAHRFAAHIGLYTPCNTGYAKDAEVGPAPIRLFHGVVDDYVAIGPCREYAARLKEAGADVSLVEYANGQHSFDNPFQPLLVTVADAQTTRGCRLEETTGGAMLNVATKQPFTLADACVARGAHVGYDPVGASAVRAAVREFAEARLLK